MRDRPPQPTAGAAPGAVARRSVAAGRAQPTPGGGLTPGGLVRPQTVLARRPATRRMLWVTAALAGCFVGVRWGLRDAPLLWFAALRALLGGAALAVVAAAQHRPLPRSAGRWAGIGALGVVNVSIAFTAMFAGIDGSATGTAAVLANAQPLLILLPAWWLYGERVCPRAGLALAVGFGGLVVVAVPGGGGSGALLSLLAAVSVTAGTLMVRRLGDLDLLVAAAAHLLIGGLVLAGAALVVEGPPDIAWTPRFLAVLAFLGLVATAATTLAWFVEANRCPVSTLTPWMFLVPVFGVLIGIAVLGERPGPWTVTGIALVLAGMRTALTQHAGAGAGPGHLHTAGTLDTGALDTGALDTAGSAPARVPRDNAPGHSPDPSIRQEIP